jgi:hypothetical protein
MEGAAPILPGRTPFTCTPCIAARLQSFSSGWVRSFGCGIGHQLFTRLICLDGSGVDNECARFR